MQQNYFTISSPQLKEAIQKLGKLVQKSPAEALNLIQEISQMEGFNDELLAKAYTDKYRGIIFFSIKQYDKAYKYFKKALENFTKVGDLREQSNVLNNISLYYNSRGEYYKAVEQLEKVLEIQESLGNRQGQLVIYNNICEIYRNIGRHDKAIRIYEKVLCSTLNKQDRLMICLMKVNLADSFLMTGMLKEAENWIENNQDNITKCADINMLKLHYRNCYNYHRLKGNFEEALECYISFSDFREQQNKRMDDFQSEFFLKKQELEILKKQKQELEVKNKHLLSLQASLEDKNTFLNTIIHTIPIPFFVINNDEVYLECNDSFANTFGKKREDFIGKKVGVSSSMIQTELYFEMDKKLLRDKKLQIYETSLLNNDGKVINVMFFKNVYYDNNGEVAGILGSFIDLTEKKELIKSLHKSEEQLSAVFHHAAVGIAVFSVKWDALFINRYLIELLGFDLQDLKNLKHKVFSNKKSRAFFDDIFVQLRKGETKYIRKIYRMISKSNKEVWGDISISMLHDEFNNPDSFICVFSDITEAKQYEDSISKLNTLLQSVMNSPYKIYIASLDRNFRYTSYNKNYKEALQRHRKINIVTGRYYLDNYSDPEDKDIHRQILEKVLKGEIHKGLREYDYEDVHEILEYFYCPIYGSNGNIEGITIYTVDVTDKMKIQRELRHSETELKLANKTKDQFFSIIAHDLRAPLGNIKSVLDFISNNEESLTEEEKTDFIRELNMEAAETFNLLENLLLWSRSQRNGIVINPTRVEIKKLITSILKVYYSIALRKSIEITTNLEPTLIGFFDYHTIETVIRNILNNAIKFTPSGGTIMVSAYNQNDQICIVISDSGIGIPKSRLSSIFQLNEVSNINSREDSNTGLGLILSHDFIEKNNGSISIKSVVGEGSTFTIMLPKQ